MNATANTANPHHLCRGAGCPACGWSGDAARAVQAVERGPVARWYSPLTGERLLDVQVRAAAVGEGYRRDRPMDAQMGAEHLQALDELDHLPNSPHLWALLTTAGGEAWFPVEAVG